MAFARNSGSKVIDDYFGTSAAKEESILPAEASAGSSNNSHLSIISQHHVNN